MRKSELYARYDHFKTDIIEIPEEEFYQMLSDNKESTDVYHYGSTECWIVKTDGADYHKYSSWWHEGWQGDVDSDQFYCKIKKLTRAEMDEISKIFS
jgi:hypothetical protein